MIRFALVLSLFLGFTAKAVVPLINLPAAVGKPSPRLVAMKNAEDQEKWAVCAGIAPKAYSKDIEVKGWVLTAWLHCARKAEAKGEAFALSRAALAAFDASPALRMGPWQKPLQQEQAQTRLQVIERELKKNPAEAVRDMDSLLENLEPGDRDSRAKTLAFYGDWAQKQKDLDAAKLYYEQSLSEKENRAVREKYAQALLVLNQKKDAKTNDGAAGDAEFMSEPEMQFEARFANSQKNNDQGALMEDCVSYLNRFPHGKRAKWADDRVLEIYAIFQEDAQDNPAHSPLRDRALNVMEKAEPARLAEWAKILHRRGDWVGSLHLSEKALASMGNSAAAAAMLYVAGRSAEQTGDNAKARQYFETYADAHSAGDEINEVLFRLGLTHLRLGQPPSAVAVFERLLSQKNKDRYELSARYWMVRALALTQNPRAGHEADSLMQKFPFSYYGLKLRAEANQGVLDWPGTPAAIAADPAAAAPAAPVLKGKMALTGPQKKSWNRIRILSAAGWRPEALAEIGAFPDPTDAQLKVLLAQAWSQGQVTPAVIKLINEASDEGGDFRARDFIAMGYPKDFQILVEGEAKRFGLQPILVWSLMRQESAFNAKAVSSSNALGLMQLIPPTAKEVAANLKLGNLDLPDDAFNPERNVPMGTSYLSQMIRRYQGSVPLGLAAYNAGPGRMDAFVKARPGLTDEIGRAPQAALDELWMDEIPWFETSFYVKAILRNTLIYRLLDQRRVPVEMTVWKDLVQNPPATASGPTSAPVAH